MVARAEGVGRQLEDVVESDSSTRVAVFWDFENLAIGQHDFVHGKDAWRDQKNKWARRAQIDHARLDVTAVLLHALSLGSVAVNRAYGDWSRPEFNYYATTFADHEISMVQQFSSDAGKNGADIRIALDIAETMQRRADITDILVCSGDSDFYPLLQLCIRMGRQIHGVGVEKSTSQLWRKACKFVSYQVLADRNEQDLLSAPERYPSSVYAIGRLKEALELLPRGRWVEVDQLRSLVRTADWGLDLSRTTEGSVREIVRVAANAGVVEVEEIPSGSTRIRLILAPLPMDAPMTVIRSEDVEGTAGTAQFDVRRRTQGSVAVYWDLEDLVSAEYDRVHGPGSWASDRIDVARFYKAHAIKVGDARIDVSRVLDALNSIGTISINRVYADWTRPLYGDYRRTLNSCPATDFVQIGSRSRNIKSHLLSMCVLDDLEKDLLITDVVVCAGTAGFDGVDELCVRAGIRLHAIGVPAPSNAAWRGSMHFEVYSELVPSRPTAPLPPWAELLSKCLSKHGGARVGVGSLKNEMCAIDSAFDNKAFGFNTFWVFLRAAEEMSLVLLEDEGAASKWARPVPS